MKYFLYDELKRDNCVQTIRKLELKDKNPFEITIKEATRKSVQNARMWAMLAELSKQVDWYGQRLSSEEWKDVLSASLFQLTTVPSIDGRKMVLLGKATSKFTISQMSDMIEFMFAFGAEKGVTFNE